MLLFLLLVAYPLVAVGKKTDPVGVVITTGVQLRVSPSSSARSIKTLSKDAQVRIIRSEKKWLKIEHEGKTGYVSREYIKNKKADLAPVTAAPPLDALKQKALKIDSKIGQKQKEVTAFSEKEAKIIDTLDQIESNLNVAEQKTAALQKEVTTLTNELNKNESAFNALEKEVKALETYASGRLVSLYKLSRLGTIPMIASADSLFEMLARKKSLEKLLAYDESVWKTLAVKKAAVEVSKKELLSQRQTHQTQVDALEGQTRSLSRRRAERAALLAGIQAEKALALASIASLKESASALDRQILEASRKPPEPPPPPPPPSLHQPQEPSPRDEPSEREVSHPPPEQPPAVNKPVDEFKGLLNLPVNGRIISFFGPYQLPHVNVPGFKNGIDIQAQMGEPIRAVKGGTAVFAGWFKGYGNMVILDHGNNYCTVYTHAQELFKKKGEAVKSGEVIASVGDTCSLEGPKLHFEIRYHGKPIDPLKWIEKRSQN